MYTQKKDNAAPGQVVTGDLISLDTDPEQDFVRSSLAQVCKSWTAQQGGLDCFGKIGPTTTVAANVNVLDAIAEATGTVISVDTVMKRVRVSGRNDEDVDDALGKMTRSAVFLVCTSFSFPSSFLRLGFAILGLTNT